jgi:hypothetical protein
MRIGLTLATRSPQWWPQGASYAADFTSDRYMRNGSEIAASQAYTLTRASTKYAADANGNFQLFSVDEPARTARGLSVEAATINMLTEPVRLDNWITVMADATRLPGTELGIFTQPTLVTDTGANVVSRLRHPPDQSATAGETVAISYWFRPGNSGSVLLFANGNGGSSRLVIELATGNVILNSDSRGEIEVKAIKEPVSGTFCVQVIWIPNFSAPCEVGIGPGSGTIGGTITALGAFMETGPHHTTPVVGYAATNQRAKDHLTLHLPAGLQDATVTYEDLSTKIISSISQDIVIPPAAGQEVIRTIIGRMK